MDLPLDALYPYTVGLPGPSQVWHGEHLLDPGYLQKAPRVRAWRTLTDDHDTVTVAWQHPHDDEIRFTAAPAGEVTAPALPAEHRLGRGSQRRRTDHRTLTLDDALTSHVA